MQLKVNGKPYIYQYYCPREERGRRLTEVEIHDFLVDCLIESFEKRGTRIIRHTPDFDSGADFSYTKAGKQFVALSHILMKTAPTIKSKNSLITKRRDFIRDMRSMGLYPSSSLQILNVLTRKMAKFWQVEDMKFYSGHYNYAPKQYLSQEITFQNLKCIVAMPTAGKPATYLS